MATAARYKGARMAKPKVANNYVALEESFQYDFPVVPPTDPPTYTKNYLVTNSTVDMNQIQGLECIVKFTNFSADSPLLQSMYGNFDEFRIRSVSFAFIPQAVNPTNASRSDAYIWWCPNHYNEDEDAKIPATFDNVNDLVEGNYVQHVAIEPGKSFGVTFAPQVVIDTTTITWPSQADRTIYGDAPMPWMRTTAVNQDYYVRGPVVYFRKPFSQTAAVNVYSVSVKAVIEFRNCQPNH